MAGMPAPTRPVAAWSWSTLTGVPCSLNCCSEVRPPVLALSATISRGRTVTTWQRPAVGVRDRPARRRAARHRDQDRTRSPPRSRRNPGGRFGPGPPEKDLIHRHLADGLPVYPRFRQTQPDAPRRHKSLNRDNRTQRDVIRRNQHAWYAHDEADGPADRSQLRATRHNSAEPLNFAAHSPEERNATEDPVLRAWKRTD